MAHPTTGRWKLGFVLALVTAVLWGVLPIALDIVLGGLDPYTITWYRLAVASALLGLALTATGSLPDLRLVRARGWALLLIALAALVNNYVLYLIGLPHVSPIVAQIVTQLAPMFLLLGGVIVFKERFSVVQQLGFAALTLGLLLFFNRRLVEFRSVTSDLLFGVAFLIMASVAWATYGLAQKRLLEWFRPQQIMWLLYVGSIVLLLPAASLGTIRGVNRTQFWMLAFCCVNTVFSYGAFAEALEHWEVSRVSAVVALAPIVTIAVSWLSNLAAPGFIAPDPLDALSFVGALLVVAGSTACALGHESSG